MADEKIKELGEFFRKRAGYPQKRPLADLIQQLRERFSGKTNVTLDQMTGILWPKYQSDMDFFQKPKEKRTVDDFRAWMFGDLRMKASERYVPETSEAWQKFQDWLSAGTQGSTP